MFLSILVLFIVLLLSYVYWNMKVYHCRRPSPYPSIIPFVGHIKYFVNGSETTWNLFVKVSMYSLYKGGGGTSVYLLWKKICVLTDPEDCMRISNTFFNKGFFYEFMEQAIGDGLLTASGTIWKKHRKLMNTAFNSSLLEGYLKVFNSQSRKLTKQMSVEIGKGHFDPCGYLSNIALENICLTLLNHDDYVDDTTKKNYTVVIKKCLELIAILSSNVWMYVLMYWISGTKNKYETLIKQLHYMSSMVIESKKLKLKAVGQENIPCKKRPKFKSFIDMLMDLNHDNIITDKQMTNEVDTIISTGSETVSTTLLKILIVIGSHSEIQGKLYQELKEIFETSNRDVEKQDLSKMVYMEAVIKECLRLYPSVPFVARHIDEDIQLDKWNISKGTCCVISIYGLHLHPAWGSDADQFRPERWLDHTTPDTTLYYVPFGIGRRDCIGKKFAMMSLKTTISHLLRNYRVFGNNENLKFKIDTILKHVSAPKIYIEPL